MTCALIIPYFGKFKNYFDVFLKSFSYNPQFNLLLITDNDETYLYPSNVKKINMSFEQFRELVQSKFDFNISLEKPYKLCDYKPAYGYICEQWLEGYDYWGHCDCDLIFGDLSPVEHILSEGYDKVFTAGHLTIYKNRHENNRIFMGKIDGLSLYQKVYQSPKIFAFDEVVYSVSVNDLFAQCGKKIYAKDMSYNCSTKHKNLTRVMYDDTKKRWIEEKTKFDQLYLNEGRLYRIFIKNGKLSKEEFIYIHLQMRNMKYKVDDQKRVTTYKINADSIVELDKLPDSCIEFKKTKRIVVSGRELIKFAKRIKSRFCRQRLVQWDKPWEYNPYDED